MDCNAWQYGCTILYHMLQHLVAASTHPTPIHPQHDPQPTTKRDFTICHSGTCGKIPYAHHHICQRGTAAILAFSSSKALKCASIGDALQWKSESRRHRRQLRLRRRLVSMRMRVYIAAVLGGGDVGDGVTSVVIRYVNDVVGGGSGIVGVGDGVVGGGVAIICPGRRRCRRWRRRRRNLPCR